MVYYKDKNRKEALNYLEKSLKVYEAEKGYESITVAKIAYEIGKINYRLCYYKEAMNNVDRAL